MPPYSITVVVVSAESISTMTQEQLAEEGREIRNRILHDRIMGFATKCLAMNILYSARDILPTCRPLGVVLLHLRLSCSPKRRRIWKAQLIY